jgi:hypothetical protein
MTRIGGHFIVAFPPGHAKGRRARGRRAALVSVFSGESHAVTAVARLSAHMLPSRYRKGKRRGWSMLAQGSFFAMQQSYAGDVHLCRLQTANAFRTED